MTNPDLTEIAIVQDRSGSMASCQSESQKGVNAFIESQRAVKGETHVTFVQFDDRIDMMYENKPIHLVFDYKLQPRGSTALLDAIGKTIFSVGERLASTPESSRPNRVFFVINTDGEENASREYTLAQISDMITVQRDQWKWEFIFLGADQDAIATASAMGIAVASTLSYDSAKTGDSYTVLANSVTAARTTNSSTQFTDDDRKRVQ